MRTYDRLTTQDSYKPLAKYDSDLSKRTAKILESRGMGQPLENAQGFDQWRYAKLDDLQTAADVARLQLSEEAASAAAAAAGGQANQQAAGLSVGAPGAAAPVTGNELPLTKEGGVDFDKLRADTQQRAQTLGITV